MKLSNGKFTLALTTMLLGFSFQANANNTETDVQTNYQTVESGVVAASPNRPGSGFGHHHGHKKKRAARNVREAKMGLQNMKLHREFSFSGHYTERTFERSMRRLDRIADMLGGHGSPWSNDDDRLFFAQDSGESIARRGDGRPGFGKPGHGKPGHGNPGHGNPGHGDFNNAERLLDTAIDDLRNMARGGEIRFHEQYARQNWRANMDKLRDAKQLLDGSDHNNPGTGNNFRLESERYLQRYLGYNAQAAINALPFSMDESDYRFVQAIGSTGNVYSIANGLRSYFTNHRPGASFGQYKHEAGAHILRSLQDWNRDQCLATLPAQVSRAQAEEVQRILYRVPTHHVSQALRNYFMYGNYHN